MSINERRDQLRKARDDRRAYKDRWPAILEASRARTSPPEVTE